MKKIFSHTILIGSGVAAGYGAAKLMKTKKTGTYAALMGLGVVLAYGIAIYFDMRAWNMKVDKAFVEEEKEAEKQVKS